jgi:hypothetical protein
MVESEDDVHMDEDEVNDYAGLDEEVISGLLGLSLIEG